MDDTSRLPTNAPPSEALKNRAIVVVEGITVPRLAELILFIRNDILLFGNLSRRG
jgi:hypothetical protein